MEINNEYLDNYSPEMIAKYLFSEDPKLGGSHQMCVYQEGEDITMI